MGGNAAEAHPCGFKWVTEAKANRGAKLIVVDPRFTRSASVADFYAPIRQGSDIAFLMGVINYCIRNDKIQWDYVKAFTNAPYLVKEGFAYADGLFTGYEEAKRDYDRSTWDYEIGADGYVISDDTLSNPRCVWQLLKEHVSIYTPELVERICGTPKDKYLKICEMIGECSSKTKTMTSLYALGWTQHSSGSQNIRGMAMLQLLLGDIGVRGGGMNALRGHSNIQGLTDVGLLSNAIPGYLTLPVDHETTFDSYMSTRAFKPLRPGQTSYYQNTKKFFVSFLKAMYGDAATAENNFGYDWLPKLDVPNYDVLRTFELMHEGRVNGYICQGFNPLLSFPNRAKITQSLSNLKFLIVMDPLRTETARFWEDHGEHNAVDPTAIQTEVIELPTTCFAEETGSLTNSGRWLQWHWAGATPPGEAHHDLDYGEHLPSPSRPLREGRGRRSRANSKPRLALSRSNRAFPGRAGERAQWACDRRYRRPQRPGQDRHRQRQVAGQFLCPARRRQNELRLLDLLRLFQRSGQQHGPSRQQRSRQCQSIPQLGLGLAAQ
jgi:formate dehydrogenase major subunit